MSKEVIVVMESEEYGREEFRYGTHAEALVGIARLEAKAESLNDGVERNIYIEN
jgi:hypothetical protein